MVTLTGHSYQTAADLPTTLDETLDFTFCPSTQDSDMPSFRESSIDTSSSNSSGPFASSISSLDFTSDILAPPTNKAFMEESVSSFDWSKWETWMQWGEDNSVVESPIQKTASSPVSYENPSLSTLDGKPIPNNQNLIDAQSFLGSSEIPTDATNSFAFKEMPFEYGLNKPLLAVDNDLPLPVDPTKPPTDAFLDSGSFSLEQDQFFWKPDTCSSHPLEQLPPQNLDLVSCDLSGNNFSTSSDSRRCVSTPSPKSDLSSQSRKRKSSTDEEDADLATTKSKRILGAKEAHKAVEKKYRTNINDKIAVLRDSIPSFQQMRKGSQGNENSDDDIGNLDCESRQAGRPNKGLILSKATEYIRHLERRNKKLNKEIAILKIQLNAFRTLAMAGSLGLRNGAIQSPNNGQAIYSNKIRQPCQTDSQAQTLTYKAKPVGRQSSGGGGSGGYMSKLMVGSLAGLMILQGFKENEQTEERPSSRGLFGLPTGYMGSIRHVVHSIHQSHVIEYMPLLGRQLVLFKAVLLIGAVLYLISPSFFDTKPTEKPNPMSNVEPTAAPSLASPVEVRRSAWLTAVQTVWVPRQSFLLQIAALLLKSLKLFVRNSIGWHRYAMLTGASEDQEAARVKAWEIALDAQLAGGDAEISISRLVLTLIASGTLPETPYRLMLRALHINILLWKVAHSGLGARYLYRSFAARLVRYQWEKARKLQMQVKSFPPSNRASGSDTLPDYLAHLLDLDSDAIMVDVVVQRAYNLAWNKPTADNVVDYVDAMDGIIDDPAIRSPLDALAAWYSNLVLHEVFTISLEATAGNADLKTAIQDGLDVALKIAPTASLVQIRAISARAVLLKEGRGANIAAALQNLPMLSLQSINGTLTKLETAPSNLTKSLNHPDLALAIQCAMCIALLERPKYSKSAIAFAEKILSSHDTFGLLGFTAMYNFLAVAFRDKNVANEIRDVLENVAGALKIWMGQKQSENRELGKEAMVNVATLCVDVFNWLVGMNGDYSDGLGLRDSK